MKNRYVTSVLCTTAALWLGGCAGIQKTEADIKQVNVDLDARLAALKAQAAERSATSDGNATKGARETVDTPWFSNDPRPVDTGSRPAGLKLPFKIKSATPMTMNDVASIVGQYANVPVRIAPEVAIVANNAQFTPSFSGTVEDFLAYATSAVQLSLRADANGVQIFNVETRVFRSKRSPGGYNSTISIGGTSNTSTGATSSTGSTSATGQNTLSSSVTGTSGYEPWKELRASLSSALSSSGKVTVSEASGTIVVTDTPTALARVEKIIEVDNRLSTVPINVKLEIISVEDTSGDDLGVNWNAIFNSLSGKNYGLTFSAPAALSQGAVGSFKAVVGADASGSRSLANSDLLIAALHTTGKTTTLLRREFPSLHNIPVSLAKTSTTAYRARVTPSGVASTTGASEPGVEPGSVTTGIKLFVTPTWIGNDEYIINVVYDDSFLKQLKALGTGKQVIDAPEVDATQTFSIVNVRNGWTSVVNTLELDSNSVDTTGLTSLLTTGKGTKGSKLRFFMLLTVAQGPF